MEAPAIFFAAAAAPAAAMVSAAAVFAMAFLPGGLAGGFLAFLPLGEVLLSRTAVAALFNGR